MSENPRPLQEPLSRAGRHGLCQQERPAVLGVPHQVDARPRAIGPTTLTCTFLLNTPRQRTMPMLDGFLILLWCGAVAFECDTAAWVGLAGYIAVKWLGVL